MPPSALYRAEHPEAIKAATARYRAKHREELRAAEARRRKANPEKARATKARNYAAHAKERNAYQARYDAEPEHAKERKAYQARWSKAHPERRAVHRSKRRARKRGNGVGDTVLMAAFRKRIAKARRIKCYWCREWVPKGHRHVDHIIPIAKGGPDAEWNLCCSCQKCNSSKHAKDPGEFSGQYELPLAV